MVNCPESLFFCFVLQDCKSNSISALLILMTFLRITEQGPRRWPWLMGNERHVATARKEKKKKAAKKSLRMCGGEAAAAGKFLFSTICAVLHFSYFSVQRGYEGTVHWYAFSVRLRFMCVRKGNVMHCSIRGEVSLPLTPNELQQNNRRRLHTLYREEILGTNCAERGLTRSNILLKNTTTKKVAQCNTWPLCTETHQTTPLSHAVMPGLLGECTSLWLCWWSGKGLGLQPLS